MRCAILDEVPWFPGVLLWMDVSVRCPPRKCVETRVAAVAGETVKTKRYGTAVRPLVFETYGRLGGEGTNLLLRPGDNGGKWAVQPARSWTMENPVGASIADRTSRHILEGAGIQGRGASRC